MTEPVPLILVPLVIVRIICLKRGFEGKLVPQDPNDEPASVLLDRIKQEREGQARQAKIANPKRGRARRAGKERRP